MELCPRPDCSISEGIAIYSMETSLGAAGTRILVPSTTLDGMTQAVTGLAAVFGGIWEPYNFRCKCLRLLAAPSFRLAPAVSPICPAGEPANPLYQDTSGNDTASPLSLATPHGVIRTANQAPLCIQSCGVDFFFPPQLALYCTMVWPSSVLSLP